MARRRRLIKAPPKLAYVLLDRAQEPHVEFYRHLDHLVDKFHEDLREAKIALAYCTSWKADKDGHTTLGKCKRATDLDRELSPWDFVILLNETFWTAHAVTTEQRLALLDHELCHAAVRRDKDGDWKRDPKGRLLYRLRKHDLEEFRAIVERHGLWKHDLEKFAQALRRHTGQQTLELETKPAAAEPAPARTH